MLVIFYSFSSVLFKRLLYLKPKLLAPCNLKKKCIKYTNYWRKIPPVVSNQVRSAENVMSKILQGHPLYICGWIYYFITQTSWHYRPKAACVMEAYANIDFLWLTSKCLQIIFVHSWSLSLHPATDKWVNIQCVSIPIDTMHRLSVAINSRRVRAGQGAGKAESPIETVKRIHTVGSPFVQQFSWEPLIF